MDCNPACNISWQRIKTAKYIMTTFNFHSTSYLFNGLQVTLSKSPVQTQDDDTPTFMTGKVKLTTNVPDQFWSQYRSGSGLLDAKLHFKNLKPQSL